MFLIARLPLMHSVRSELGAAESDPFPQIVGLFTRERQAGGVEETLWLTRDTRVPSWHPNPLEELAVIGVNGRRDQAQTAGRLRSTGPSSPGNCQM